MIAYARQRAVQLGWPVALCVGDAQAIPFADSRFDTVVATLALCTIPDERQALREVARVLRPGGRLLLLEHVRSPNALVRAGQRLLDPLFVRWEADHLLRDPLDHLAQVGLEVVGVGRSRWGIVERLVARKPG